MAKMNESTAAIYARDANDIALTEDGTQLLAYGAAFIRSYDVATKQLMHNLPGLGSSLAVYARGKLVLIGPPQDVDADPSPNSAVLRVLEVPTGRLISVLRRLPANAYSPPSIKRAQSSPRIRPYTIGEYCLTGAPAKWADHAMEHTNG